MIAYWPLSALVERTKSVADAADRLERGGWNETAKLTATDAAVGDELGSSVAIAGDTIVAGAPLADNGDQVDHGAVYTFARPRSTAHLRDSPERLMEANGAPGEVVLESIGGPIVDHALKARAHGGRLVAYGQASGASNRQRRRLDGSLDRRDRIQATPTCAT